MKNWLMAFISMAIAGAALAKLPALSEEAKAAAELTKAKSAWSDKVAAFKLCQTQDKLAGRYLKDKGAAKPAVETPPCTDPGAFVPPAPQAATATPAAPAAAGTPAAGAPAAPATPAATAPAAAAPAATAPAAPAQAAATPPKK
jgi:hypothetical protein